MSILVTSIILRIDHETTFIPIGYDIHYIVHLFGASAFGVLNEVFSSNKVSFWPTGSSIYALSKIQVLFWLTSV